MTYLGIGNTFVKVKRNLLRQITTSIRGRIRTDRAWIMMCSTVISKLGFECHNIGETMRIISPFTYCDDGEHVGAFVREINGKFLVSDRCDALMNMESRGYLSLKTH